MSTSGTGTALHRVLERELAEAFADPPSAWSGSRFARLALRVFRAQYEGSGTYRRFCRGRGRTPETVDRWEDVPLVPATAFKELDLYSGPGEPETVFVTSGTTRPSRRRAGAGSGAREEPEEPGAGSREEVETARGRGRHPIFSLSLYRASALPWIRRHLVPEGEPLLILCLVPGPADAPASSLSRMMGFLVDDLGAPGSGFFAGPAGTLRQEALEVAMEEAAAVPGPVLVMGTAFAWVHWLDRARERGFRVELPRGSRLMETGGFKGRSREVPRAELYRELSDALGIPRDRMVNEYGMTELQSQLYEPVLVEDPPTGLADRVHRPPPWLRVRALDPDTLAPRSPGERGLLAFFDLANLGSVSAILTQDVGRVARSGEVALEGRAPGSEPRGCSLAMEELLGEEVR